MKIVKDYFAALVTIVCCGGLVLALALGANSSSGASADSYVPAEPTAEPYNEYSDTPPPVPTVDPTACIVNGFGNELCGDSAAAYCDLLNSNSTLSANSRDVCESLGWAG